MNKESDFQKIVDRLRIDTEPNPLHKEKLRRQMLNVFESRLEQSRPRFLGVPITRLAVAAVIAVAALIGIYKFGLQQGQSSRGRATETKAALARTIQATEKMPWMHAVIKEYYDGKELAEQHWYYFAAKKTFGITSAGSVWCIDRGAGQRQFYYQPGTRTLMISNLAEGGLFGDPAYSLVDAILTCCESEDASVRQYAEQYDGKSTKVYEIEKAKPGLSRHGKMVAKLKIAIVTDAMTNLILGGGVEFLDEGSSLIARTKWDISYPQTGPREIYDLGVPRAARIIDRTQMPIGTPGYEPRPIATPDQPDQSKLAPIAIKLPKSMFVGTPQDNRVPNLERPLGRPRPPFFAPPGTKNVARGKPVSASDTEPIVGELEMITDGDKEAGEGSFVELGPFVQHVTIDLKGQFEIYAIVIWHYHKEPRVYFDVAVQICDRPGFTRGVTAIFNNDIDNSLGLGAAKDKHYTETNEGRLIDAKGVRGRYVRLYSNGNTSDAQNHYIEVEVYGRAVE